MSWLQIAHGGLTGEDVFLQAGAILLVIAAMVAGIVIGTVTRHRPGTGTTSNPVDADLPAEQARPQTPVETDAQVEPAGSDAPRAEDD